MRHLFSSITEGDRLRLQLQRSYFLAVLSEHPIQSQTATSISLSFADNDNVSGRERLSLPNNLSLAVSPRVLGRGNGEV